MRTIGELMGVFWKGRGTVPPPGSRLNAFNCSIMVDNIDNTLKDIKAAGGSVARDKAQIPGVGWLAMCVDTEGNTFGVMQPLLCGYPVAEYTSQIRLFGLRALLVVSDSEDYI